MTRPVRTWAERLASTRAGSSLSRLPGLAVAVILLCVLWPAAASAQDKGRSRADRHAVHTSLRHAVHTSLRITRSHIADLQIGSGEATRHGSVAVRRLQRGLQRAGYAPGPIDGIYGPLTAAAVERFQANHLLRVDGIVGPATRRALHAKPVLMTGAGEGRANGSPAVARLQRRLKRAGFAVGPIDGRFGPRTEHAVLAFQRARHLAVDGVAGTSTQRALDAVGAVSSRPTAPRGGRRTSHPRPAPVRHAPQPHRKPRTAQSPPPASPRLPLLWILVALGAIGLAAVLGSYYQRPISARAAQARRALEPEDRLGRRSTVQVAQGSMPAPAVRPVPGSASGAAAQPPPDPARVRALQPAADRVSPPPSMVFVIDEDNSGGFYWTIVTSRGEMLARSARFSSQDEAQRAARLVQQAAATAPVTHHEGGESR